MPVDEIIQKFTQREEEFRKERDNFTYTQDVTFQTIDEDGQVRGNVPGGIQWFATWESGGREAARTGRPILLVSAAPHCARVPGIW